MVSLERLTTLGKALRKHSKVLSAIFVIGWLCLLGWQLVRDWRNLPPDFLLNVRYIWLLASLGLLCLALLGTSLRWWLTLRVLDVPISWWSSTQIWFLSQLGRYLPGGVWNYVGRFYLGAAEIPQDTVIASMVLETGLRVISEGLVFLFTLPFWPDTSFLETFLMIPLVGGLVVGMLVLHPRVLQAVTMSRLAQRLGVKTIDFSNVRYRTVLALLFYYVMMVLSVGGAFYMLVGAFYPVRINRLPVLVGSLAASVVLGFLVPFSPNGWGVREGILAFLLGQIMSSSMAIVLSIMARIWLTVAEGLWILCILGLKRGIKPQ